MKKEITYTMTLAEFKTLLAAHFDCASKDILHIEAIEGMTDRGPDGSFDGLEFKVKV